MAEIAESASQRGMKISLISFISEGQKNFPHEILIVPQKGHKWQKVLRRVREQDFRYFLYFRGTKKLSA